MGPRGAAIRALVGGGGGDWRLGGLGFTGEEEEEWAKMGMAAATASLWREEEWEKERRREKKKRRLGLVAAWKPTGRVFFFSFFFWGLTLEFFNGKLLVVAFLVVGVGVESSWMELDASRRGWMVD